jgi:hypothetical protein
MTRDRSAPNGTKPKMLTTASPIEPRSATNVLEAKGATVKSNGASVNAPRAQR